MLWVTGTDLVEFVVYSLVNTFQVLSTDVIYAAMFRVGLPE